MKTAILFICHVVNEESRFRYDLLKKASDELGYDIFWMIDSQQKQDLPSDINFMEFSLERFTEITLLHPYVVPHRLHITRKNSTAITATQLFRMNTNDEYDRVWHIEYDVCYFGDWANFFRKYENVDSDFITSWNYERPELNMDWYHCRFIDEDLKRTLVDNPYFSITLNCCCRISQRLLIDIYDYITKIGTSCFQEWVFSTVSNMSGYQTLYFSSNHFRPSRIKGFDDFRRETIYHPLKLNVDLNQLMKRSLT